MRNVQQWKRNSDMSVLRVFKSGGIAKTLEAFLEGRYKVTNPKGVNGQLVHIPGQQYRFSKGEYAITNTQNLDFFFVPNEETLFEFMALNGYNFVGVETVRTKCISKNVDHSEFVQRWAKWADSYNNLTLKNVMIEDGGNAVIPIKPDPKVQENFSVEVSKGCGIDLTPEGWVCTRQAGHEGPCAAVQIETSKPKKKSFTERLLGFLPIFRR